MKQKVVIGGVRFNCLTQLGAVGRVAERIAQRRYDHPISVFTPNTEQLIQAVDNQGFLELLNNSDMRVPDSVGLVRADWWRAFTTGRPWWLRERVAGVDLAEALLSEAAVKGWKVGLIGGMDNASELAVVNLKKRFSGLKVWRVEVGEVAIITNNQETRNKQNLDVAMENEDEVIEKINKIGPDLLLVGLGAPKQEVWVMKYGGELAVQVILVVGGAIDFWSGVQMRAPGWVRNWGMEWLWRLIQQPWRLGRQLRLVRFMWLVARGKI